MRVEPEDPWLDMVEGWMWNGLVVLFYLPVTLGCLLYLTWRGQEYLLWTRTLGEAPLRDVGLGLLAALPVVALSRWATPRSAPLRRMASALSRALGPLSLSSCVLIAAWSAIGEELLFRGVIQAELGIGVATLLFAVAHVPFERNLWLWPVFALGTGLLLGGLFAATEAVLAPGVCHFVINLLNLQWLVRLGERGKAGADST